MKHLNQLMLVGSLLCTMAVGIPSTVLAVPTLVTDRVTLAGNDVIDWSGFGPSISSVSSGSAIASNGGGITATVSMPSGTMQGRTQGPSWFGNFAPGDPVLFTGSGSNPGPITIEFDNPVFGAGANIQGNYFGAFTGILEVFSGGTLLDTFNLAGVSNSHGNNSAIFLGVSNNVQNITKLVYSVDNPVNPDSFGINHLDLVTGFQPGSQNNDNPPVPEPSTILLLGSGLVGLVAWRKKKSQV